MRCFVLPLSPRPWLFDLCCVTQLLHVLQLTCYIARARQLQLDAWFYLAAKACSAVTVQWLLHFMRAALHLLTTLACNHVQLLPAVLLPTL